MGTTSTILEDIKKKTNANSAFIFQMHLATLETEIFSSVNFNKKLSEEEEKYLRFTPIERVIIGDVFGNDHQGKAKQLYKYLKCLGSCKSVIGCRIDYTDEYGYALFLLGEYQGQLNKNAEEAVKQATAILGATIERKKFEE